MDSSSTLLILLLFVLWDQQYLMTKKADSVIRDPILSQIFMKCD